MRHVLITGGAGFVGSHLCDLFLSRGYAVTAVDNLITGRKANLAEAQKHSDFEFREADVCEPLDEKSLRLFKAHGLHGVLHFACPASPVDFDRIPFVILRVDSLGTMRTVDLAARHGARFMLASTSEIYGDPLVHPQAEGYWGNVSTTGPRACYDEAKRFAEAYVTTAMRSAGGPDRQGPARALDARLVRIFNTYGPRMRADDGRVVPELCMQALRGEPLTVHGEGKQTRSFCFVSDLCEGIFRLFESDVRLPVNVGNPVERSILEFAQTVAKLAGNPKAGIRHLPARPDDPWRRCPDIARAKELLAWTTLVPLEEGLARSLEYFRTQLV